MSRSEVSPWTAKRSSEGVADSGTPARAGRHDPSPTPAGLRTVPNPAAITPPSPRRAPIIEGGFTHDALPDLFRYLCSRAESLIWELSTLAGTFEMVIDRGTPVDVMFRPVRPIGAQVGIRALRILFRQEGGRFTVRRGEPTTPRQTLHQNAENLLIELATLDDESSASAVMSGTTFDVSAELDLVKDLAPEDHRTAFRTRTEHVPLIDVLQLFSVNRQAFWVQLIGPQERHIGRLEIVAGEVFEVEYGPLRKGRAFTSLLKHAEHAVVDVTPILSAELKLLAASREHVPLGRLDALLMQEILSGRLTEDGRKGRRVKSGTLVDTVDGALNTLAGTQVEAAPASAGPARAEASEKPAGGLLGRLFGRRRG